MSDTLGKLLSDRRLKQGLTVEEVSERTRINSKFIRAAEADQFEGFPGVVFVKGFLRTYASVLGLDGDDLVAKYEALKIEERDHSPKLISMPLHDKSFLTDRNALFLVFLAVALAGWMYFYLSSEDSLPLFKLPASPTVETPQTQTAPATVAEENAAANEDKEVPTQPQPEKNASLQPKKKETTPEPAEPSAEQAPNETAVEPSPEEKPEESASVKPPSTSDLKGIEDTSRPYSLTIQGVADTWIRVVIDGDVTREIILREGHTVTWWAERGYKLSIGNVAGTKVFLNNDEVQLNQPASNIIMNLVLPPSSARDVEANTAERQ